jgi:TolB-like protein
MKRCPSCNRVEPDDALAFCRADGTALVTHSLSGGESRPASVLGNPSSEIETSILPHSTDAGISRATGATTVFEAQPGLARTHRLVSVKRRKVIVLAIAGLVVVTLALLVYIYRTRSSNTTIDSIAVIPFVNASGDPNNEYLSDGITESIINSLSQLPNLGVIARNSAFHYKGKDADATTVGRELNVRSILTGRVLQRGDNLSISVELVDTANNHQLWGQKYNRNVADVFAVQEEIAKEISEKLRVKLSGTERQHLAKRPTENLKALQYYMQGRSYLNRRTREDLLIAIRYCEKAIEEDHNYALAYAGLADAYSNLGVRGYIAPSEGRFRAEEAARKALALDENLAEAHVAFGQPDVQFVPYNFPLGDRELRRAIELSPSIAVAHYYLGYSLLRQGRLDEGLDEILKSRELDPLSSTIARGVAMCHSLRRDYVRALELLRQSNELGPSFSTTIEI